MSRLPFSLHRRHFLYGAGAIASAAVLPHFALGEPVYGRPLGEPAKPGPGRVHTFDFTAAERPMVLPCFDGHALPLWKFEDASYPTTIRVQLGDTIEVKVRNDLPGDEHLTIHWHGLRIPNAQDGVPYLTQPPIETGQVYTYRFTPPDTGTFFFHTHCNTVTSLGRGLAGILIVDGDETEPYDADETIVLKDWRINASGDGFEDFYTLRGAAGPGTFGSVRSANGAHAPEIEVPAGADVRLRLLNIDSTRVIGIGVRGAAAEAAVIAIDGCGVTPYPSRYMALGPAQRVDLAIRTPGDGGIVEIADFRRSKPLRLASLRAVGPKRRAQAFNPAPLSAPRMAPLDLSDAPILPVEFSTTPLGGAADGLLDPGSICGTGTSFWSINKKVWPADAHDGGTMPPPLATLQRGKTYIFEMANISKQIHPIHLHGHSFQVISNEISEMPVHHADTVLMVPRERTRIAFVADNPGDWMFHCHIIEHQETGMMGYIRVT